MRYVAAYLLACLGGNESPSAADLKKILESVGVNVDDEELNKVVSELNGKSIAEVIAEGQEKLASVPSGGGAVAVSSGGSGDSAAPAEAEAAPEPEEEEEEEDMDFDLFD